MSVRVAFEYDPAVHYRALRAVTALTPFRYAGIAMAGVALVLAGMATVPTWDETDPLTRLTTALPWLMLAAFWVMLVPLQQRWSARKLPAHDKSLVGSQERVVDESGYRSLGNGVELSVPWHAMARVVETDAFMFFFYHKQLAYYIPKTATALEQWQELRRLAREALGERATLLRT